MNCVERTLSFECGGESLLGIVSTPLEEKAQADTGVVIIVGGPQYRVGSHRQFVLLARALAANGFPVMRFDYRGMGDSSGELRTFENTSEDIATAITALQAATGVTGVALWGLCDGASAALLYCHAKQDTRVKGLCLLNPWVRSDSSLATTQIKHYYRQRLREKEFWLKFFSGKVAGAALAGLWRNMALAFGKAGRSKDSDRSQSFQQNMAEAWTTFDGNILLLLSGDDYTAKEFMEYVKSNDAWSSALTHPKLAVREMIGLDHTCSGTSGRHVVERHTVDWLQASVIQPA